MTIGRDHPEEKTRTTVEALNGDSNALKKGVDEINSWTVQGTKVLYCSWLKAVVRERIPVFFPVFSVLPALPLHQILSLPPPHMTQPAWMQPKRPRPKVLASYASFIVQY